MDGVTKSIIVSRNNNEKKLEQEHFVLVHGAGHGAWCWYRLLALLRRSGHRVSCVDLAATTRSSGVVASFEEYTAPLVDLMEALPDGEKVILVGHSAGGLSLTHAMHLFSDRIKQAIFIAATMLPFGFQTEQDIKDGVPDLSKLGDVYELTFGLGDDHPPTGVALREEFQRRILYQQSPLEVDQEFAALDPASSMANSTEWSQVRRRRHRWQRRRERDRRRAACVHNDGGGPHDKAGAAGVHDPPVAAE